MHLVGFSLRIYYADICLLHLTYVGSTYLTIMCIYANSRYIRSSCVTVSWRVEYLIRNTLGIARYKILQHIFFLSQPVQLIVVTLCVTNICIYPCVCFSNCEKMVVLIM